LLLPNIVLPVVLLPVEPNMPVPVFAFEPKPDAGGKLDTVGRSPGAVGRNVAIA
jgi:hypothetical protein